MSFRPGPELSRRQEKWQYSPLLYSKRAHPIVLICQPMSQGRTQGCPGYGGRQPSGSASATRPACRRRTVTRRGGRCETSGGCLRAGSASAIRTYASCRERSAAFAHGTVGGADMEMAESGREPRQAHPAKPAPTPTASASIAKVSRIGSTSASKPPRRAPTGWPP